MWQVYPLKTVRQVALLAVVFLGLTVIGAVTVPKAGWAETLVAFVAFPAAWFVEDVVYRRWWQPKS